MGRKAPRNLQWNGNLQQGDTTSSTMTRTIILMVSGKVQPQEATEQGTATHSRVRTNMTHTSTNGNMEIQCTHTPYRHLLLPRSCRDTYTECSRNVHIYKKSYEDPWIYVYNIYIYIHTESMHMKTEQLNLCVSLG